MRCLNCKAQEQSVLRRLSERLQQLELPTRTNVVAKFNSKFPHSQINQRICNTSNEVYHFLNSVRVANFVPRLPSSILDKPAAIALADNAKNCSCRIIVCLVVHGDVTSKLALDVSALQVRTPGKDKTRRIMTLTVAGRQRGKALQYSEFFNGVG